MSQGTPVLPLLLPRMLGISTPESTQSQTPDEVNLFFKDIATALQSGKSFALTPAQKDFVDAK